MIIYRKGKPYEILIDEADKDLISQYKWHIHSNNNTNYVRGYKKDDKNYKLVYMHRLIMSAPFGIQVDHDNRNGLDCRRQNLCLISRNGNSRKKIVKNKSGFKGVHPRPSGRFFAQMTINHKVIGLGTFDTAEEASIVYQTATNNQLKKEIINGT
jgi:hypothetical protein